MRLNLPTNLTLLRILLIPVLVIVYYLPVNWSYVASAIVFAVAGATDWLDGYLARKMGQTTAFGAFLDPVADKLMVAVVLVLIVQNDPQPWVALGAAVIIGREITIASLREWMAEIGQRKKVEVSWLGKAKTLVQMVSIICLLLPANWHGVPAREVGYVLLFIAASLTLWSMIVYLRAALPTLMGQN